MEVVVFGNVTLDVLCSPVDDVPRTQSISFERSIVSPGGCGSNVAIGLAALKTPSALVAWTGDDQAGDLLRTTWSRWGIDTGYVQRTTAYPTAVSVGLVDSQAQPRFIHTPGANCLLTAAQIMPEEFMAQGAQFLHIAGYFVLPGLMDLRLGEALAKARNAGLKTSLDVVHSPRMDTPDMLWSCLRHLDYFLCNEVEACKITGEADGIKAAMYLQQKGAENVLIKLGSRGCYLLNPQTQTVVQGFPTKVIDTTGAGDAFAAGLLTGLTKGLDLVDAIREGNKAGAKVVTALGTVSAWGDPTKGDDLKGMSNDE